MSESKIMGITNEGLNALQKCMDLTGQYRVAALRNDLVDGNEIFVLNRGDYYRDLPKPTEEKRKELRDFFRSHNSDLEEVKHHQTPTVAVLACSDSRADPAIIFSLQGINKVFVVRNAGNVFSSEVEESMVVPVNHDVSVIVICGHYKCGAMGACSMVRRGKAENNAMPSIINRINAIVPEGVTNPDDMAKFNVADVLYCFANTENPVLKDAFVCGKTKLMGAMYDIDSGKVDFLSYEEIASLLKQR